MLPIAKTIFKALIIIIVYIPVSSGNAESNHSYTETGIIQAGRLNVRKGPERHQKVVGKLKRGDEVNIIENTDGWLKISFNDGTGYIRNREKYVIIKRPDPIEQDEILEQEEEVVHRIKTQKAKFKAYNAEENTVINELDELDFLLNKLNQRISNLKQELESVEKKINATTKETKDLINTIDDTEQYIFKRLTAYYKLNLIGRTNVLASANSMYDVLNRQYALEHILSYDEAILKNQMHNKKKLAELLEDLNQQKQERVTLVTKYHDQRQIISRKKSKRFGMLDEIRNKKSLTLAAIESIKQAAKALDQTIESLNVAPEKDISIPGHNFEEYKGLLNMPVRGKIRSFFGPYKNKKFNVTNFNSGVEIEADRGEPIRAVLGGIILYSGWFKNYGNMIIIDHGNHYYTVYAHAEELFKSKGDVVEKDEVIATVGETASMAGSNLYFEVRHHGKSMDPMKWLKTS